LKCAYRGATWFHPYFGVQPKAITFPTDSKLLHAAIKGLNRMANKHSVRLSSV
jgi:hypothetical protein